ncbi:MAG: two-component system OmpR family response regulator [Bradymonadia bacterium]|jgi:two-component system OmpR family response regulator
MSPPLQRVLYVEDEPDIRSIAELALETVGQLTICSCSSGELAIEAAEAFAPHLLLLDVMMPGMDGPETLRRLREIPALSEIPAVFMTAKVQPDEVSHLKALGAFDVLPKPFDPMTIADELRKIFDIATLMAV